MPARTPITSDEVRQKGLGVLQFIVKYVDANNHSPSLIDIAGAIPTASGDPASESVAYRYVLKLKEQGLITHEKGIARSIRPTDTGRYAARKGVTE